MDDSFFSIKAFLLSGYLRSSWSTDFTGNLFTFGFGAVFLYVLSILFADNTGPFSTFLFSGITLGDIFTFLVLDGLAFNNIIRNVVFLISGLALRLIHGLASFWTVSLDFDWSVAEGYGIFGSDLSVFNETALDEVFFTVFFLLWLEINGICCVAFLTVAVFTGNNIVVFSLLYHNNLVNTSLTSGGNGSNVKGNLVTTSTSPLASITDIIKSSLGVMSVMILVVTVMTVVNVLWGSSPGISSSVLTEWESSTKIFSSALSKSASGDKSQQENLQDTLMILFTLNNTISIGS